RIRGLAWSYRATLSMGRPLRGAVLAMVLCSRLTPIGQALRLCTPSPAVATELIRLPDWFYRATPCMERQLVEAICGIEIPAWGMAVARCSPSTLMAPVLRPCTISRPSRGILADLFAQTMTELIRLQL